MLLDAQNLFSENQSITSGTIVSQNTVRFGEGDVSYAPLIIQVVEAFSVATNIKVKVQTSEDAAFTTPTTLVETSLELAKLKAGAKFPVAYLPKGNLGYMRLVYEVPADETETTGKITAGVVAGV